MMNRNKLEEPKSTLDSLSENWEMVNHILVISNFEDDWIEHWNELEI